MVLTCFFIIVIIPHKACTRTRGEQVCHRTIDYLIADLADSKGNRNSTAIFTKVLGYTKDMSTPVTAAQFMDKLETLRTPAGIRMGSIFALAKDSIDMSLTEIKKLLASPMHEARVGAVSVMDFQARSKKTSPERKKELFDLYIQHHDLINTWDLVDRSAIYVVGGYLSDKPRDILYKLARSKDMNQRRTAAVAAFYFIMRQDDVRDAFKIAGLLVNEKELLTQKAAGWVLREAGKHDPKRLLGFLDTHAKSMPRPMLRNAIERLPKDQKAHYLSLGMS